jgi:non-ribosomal peptide synthetase component F
MTKLVCENATPGGIADLYNWNRTLSSADGECVHQLIERHAREQPDAVAVDAHDGILTYHQLDSHSSRLARHLVDHGVKPDSVVPLCFEHSMWVVVAKLAVLKAGAAFTSIPCSPLQRAEEIINNCHSNVVLTSPQTAIALDGLSRKLRIIPSDETDSYSETDAPMVDVKPGNLAYVIFTSGSTGTPKVSSILISN